MFPMRYELNFYLRIKINLIFKGSNAYTSALWDNELRVEREVSREW
jgi:hypothetical protein